MIKKQKHINRDQKDYFFWGALVWGTSLKKIIGQRFDLPLQVITVPQQHQGSQGSQTAQPAGLHPSEVSSPTAWKRTWREREVVPFQRSGKMHFLSSSSPNSTTTTLCTCKEQHKHDATNPQETKKRGTSSHYR